MKKPFISMVLSLLMLVLIGFAIFSVYDLTLQFSEIVRNPEPPWELSINVMPLFLLLIFGIIITFIYARKRKNKEKISYWLFPFEFSEEDEREQQISGEACRKAFTTTWVTAPLAATLFAAYPLFQEKVIYFPIILILAYSYCADYYLLFAYPENIKASFMWRSKCSPFTLCELFSASRAIEEHSFYPVPAFWRLHGQSERIPFTLDWPLASFTGNRNAFLLPCTNFLQLHGQSRRIPFTMNQLFAASRAIETHSFYHAPAFCRFTGNRNAFLLPCTSFLRLHGQSKGIPFTLY